MAQQSGDVQVSSASGPPAPEAKPGMMRLSSKSGSPLGTLIKIVLLGVVLGRAPADGAAPQRLRHRRDGAGAPAEVTSAT